MPKPTSFVRGVSCTLIAVFAIIGPLGSLTAHASQTTNVTPSVVIGEVAWAGSSLSTADEWLELWNLSDQSVSIGNWTLRGAGESGKTLTLPATASLSPRSAYLISNYAASDTKGVLAAPVDVVTTTISLPNSGLSITLTDALGTIIDTAGSGTNPPAGTSLPAKASMIRIASVADGALATSWITATSSRGFKPGIADLGSPGICDGCTVAPPLVEAALVDDPPLIESTPPAEEPSIPPEATPPTEDVQEDAPLIESAPTGKPETTNPEEAANETVTPEGETESDPALIEETPLEETTSTDPVPETTTTEPDIVQTPTSPSPTTASISSPTPTALLAPNYSLLRLNEISPNPTAGKEWVEIISTDATQTISLKNCELHDATGRIYTFGDVSLTPIGSRYIVVELSSARLNNDGDTVALYDPDGQLINSFSYTKTDKGSSWIRSPDVTGSWQLTLTPTQGSTNLLTLPPTTQTTTAVTNTTTASTVATTTTITTTAATTTASDTYAPLIETSPTTTSIMATTTTALASTATKKSSAKPKTATATTTKKTIPKAPTTKKTTAPKPKTTTTKITPITHLTFDMLNDSSDANLRVQLQGTVGSPPGLLTSHAFVLQSPDGRGLLVKVPTTKKLPEYGTTVTVVGALHFDTNNVPYLQLGAKDQWQNVDKTSLPAVPRVVDLLAPGAEDVWSLIHVTGTVLSVSGSTIHLDLDDAEVEVIVRPLVHYRAKRLIPGDVITISGLLDMTATDPRIFPRVEDDILLINHAPEKITQAATSTGSSSLPGWTPFGAAAGAIGVTEGAKQLRRRKQQRDLEKKLLQISQPA